MRISWIHKITRKGHAVVSQELRHVFLQAVVTPGSPPPFPKEKRIVIWPACKDKRMTTTKTGPHTILNQENQLEAAVQSCPTKSCSSWKPPNAHTHTHIQAAVCDGDFQPERAGLERQTVAGEAEPLWPHILSAGSISSESIIKIFVFFVVGMICLLHL